MDNIEGSSLSISLLPDDVIELILASLPLTRLLNAALVCKEWHSFIASSHFLRALSYSIHASRPWLFVLGQSKSLSSAKNRVIGFDPLAWRWNHISPLPLIDSKKFEEPCSTMINVEEGNGILFYLAGRRLNYSLSFLNPRSKWEDSPPMSCWRHQHPVVCYLGGPTYNHIFVLGGVSDFEAEEMDPLCAEMLDLNSGVWESMDPLPYQFKAISASSTWISSVVFDDRIYLLEKYSGDCCYFDLQRKRWGCAGKLRPPPSSSSVDEEGGLVLLSGSSKKGLVVGGLRRDDGGLSFRLWNFNNIGKDEGTSVVCSTEMDRMPSHMFNLVTGKEEEEEECGEVRVKCKGMGAVIYMYSDRSNYVCACDVGDHRSGQQVWRMLPHGNVGDHRSGQQVWRMLPHGNGGIFVSKSNYNCSGRFKFVCSNVTLNQISL